MVPSICHGVPLSCVFEYLSMLLSGPRWAAALTIWTLLGLFRSLSTQLEWLMDSEFRDNPIDQLLLNLLLLVTNL